MEITAFAIKTEVRDLRAKTFVFTAQKTMYGGEPKATRCSSGKRERARARPRRAWRGHFYRGHREETRSRPSNTPRQHCRQMQRPYEEALGRSELKHFTDWNGGQPETELSFKFYRQATNKSLGIPGMKRRGFSMACETPYFRSFRRRTDLIAEG